MNYKLTLLYFLLLLSACGIEVRDKNAKPPENVEELVVESEYSLPVPLIQSQQTVLRYDRLVLKPGAQFITQGLNVRLEVKELISEGGVIRSFREDQIAAPQSLGRSGGHLELVVESASGNLKIEMRGEQGGKGLSAAAPDASLKGPKGNPGRPAIWNNILGMGGMIRMQQPTAGEPGGGGQPGFTGGTGFRGGNSGTAYIKINNAEDLHLNLQKTPGTGGVGGDGGPGGEGGDGGDGLMDSLSNYQPPNGPRGPQGPQGASGPVGQDGIAEKICVETNLVPRSCE